MLRLKRSSCVETLWSNVNHLLGTPHTRLSDKRIYDFLCVYANGQAIKQLSQPIGSASFLAEISVSSPWKLFIFITYTKLFWIKVSKKMLYLILKTEALPIRHPQHLGLTLSIYTFWNMKPKVFVMFAPVCLR